MKNLDNEQLNKALILLEGQLNLKGADPVGLVVCGGSALIATRLISRTTKDVDILAISDGLTLIDPDPLNSDIIEAAKAVASALKLPNDWLNTGPADIFRMGLPEGCKERLQMQYIGDCLTIYYISRKDQIHLKLYASIDRGGYHVTDLLALEPSEGELVSAAKWTITHDVSEGFLELLKSFLIHIGFKDAAQKI